MSIFRAGLFERQIAIVTGGSGGIGSAIAKELADLGATVVLAARGEERLKKTAEELTKEKTTRKVDYIACNIRSEEDVKRLMSETVKRHGAINMLVNNGGGQFPSPAEKITAKGWHAVIETNLTGTFYCCRHAYHTYMGEHGGAIVNIIADMFNGFPYMMHTGAARAGVENITKTLAVEWAHNGIRINSIAPGVVYSESAAANYTGEFKGILEKSLSFIPAKRLGTTEEVSSAVTYLLSPAAAYITGVTLRVDGGSSLRGNDLFQLPEKTGIPPFRGKL
eukprot:m.5081 g.5081  ORF g.5081 m.5081 type:complete len:279 (-) comp4445_c0_seq1:116-952(-)